MTGSRLTTALVAGLLLSLAPSHVRAQGIARSQQAEVRQRVADTWITVRYSRPVARGRTLFGGVVRWGRVWCPGADSATALTTTTPLVVEGRPLPAGSYGIWAIPDSAGAWTIIFSRAHAVWHVPYPGESQDQLRIRVTPRIGEHMETLAWYFPAVEGRETSLALHWGTTVVPLAIRVPD